MAFQRRRQHHNHQHRLRVVVPIISAVFSALLILFALLSFLAPSPSDTDHLHHPRRFTSVCFLSLSPYLPYFPFFNGFAAYFYFVFIYLVCRPTTSMVQLEYPFFVFRLGIHIYIYIYSKSSLKLSDLILIKYDCLRLRNKQRDGGKLDRDIWSSRNAQFYHGCSVASSKFASVYLFQCCLFVAYDLI